MKKAQIFTSLIAASYCLSCGTGAEELSTPTNGASPPSAQANASSQPMQRLGSRERVLQTRIKGREGRNRASSAYFAAFKPPYEAPPINPAIPASGQIASSRQAGAAAVGETFEVSLHGRGFVKTTEGGGLDLSFNPKLVEVVKVSVDAGIWEFLSSGGEIDNRAGTVKGISFASFAGRTGDFPIASVTFRSKAAGDSKLRVSESTINPFASGGQRIRVEIE